MTEQKYKFPAKDCTGAASILEAAARRGIKNGTVSELSAKQMGEVARKLLDESREEEGYRSFSEDDKNTVAFAFSEACAVFAGDPKTEAQYQIILELAEKFQGKDRDKK